jgi:hypothetical protein
MVRQFLNDETQVEHKSHTGSAVVIDRLRPVFEAAQDWEDLNAALLERGFHLRAMGTGTAVYRSINGRHLCNTATVGHRYRALVKRFGAPMPGHPHGMKWIRPAQEPFEVVERDRS